MRGASIQGATTTRGAKNSDVLRPGSVAIAIMLSPLATGLQTVAAKVTVLPLLLVVTLLWRRNVLASLSSEGLENNWIVNVVPSVLLRRAAR